MKRIRERGSEWVEVAKESAKNWKQGSKK